MCANIPCYFGASTSFLTLNIAEVTTVSVVPYVTELVNGTNATSYSTSTAVSTVPDENPWNPFITSGDMSTTTYVDDITWVESGTTLCVTRQSSST